LKKEIDMPGFDGTGPERMGPTGRRLGPCGEGEFTTRRGFFPFGRGRRGGDRGYRWFPTQFVNEKPDLEAEKSWLENRLEAINQLINQKED
jgi:hypothetical protein